MYTFFIIRQPVKFFTKKVTACEFFTSFFTNYEVFCEDFFRNSQYRFNLQKHVRVNLELYIHAF